MHDSTNDRAAHNNAANNKSVTMTTLLRSSRFRPFFLTQLLGAFNDNFFKNAAVVLLAFSGMKAADADVWINAAAALFILPFFLFSGFAGQLADKVEKSRLIRMVKLAEIAIMGLGAIGFFLQSLPLLLATVFFMGAQSALFGPVKYSILPQHLGDDELLSANSLVELGTFLAILLGTLAGGMVVSLGAGYAQWVGPLAIVIALVGWLFSRKVPVAEASNPSVRLSGNLWRPTREAIGHARAKRAVFLSILGISWFWFYGAVFLAQLPSFARDALQGDGSVVTALLALFSVGVGLGSALCAKLSQGRIKLGVVLAGAVGLSIFAIDLLFAVPRATHQLGTATLFLDARYWRTAFDIVAIGISGGLFTVPLYTLMQERSAAKHRSQTIAANNIVNALFMVVAALFAIALRAAGVSPTALFAIVGALNLGVVLYLLRFHAASILRGIARLVVRLGYRLEIQGMQQLQEGPALLVCNHVSFVDAIIIAAASPRPIRFVMDHRIFSNPIMRPFFRMTNAIPIASRRVSEHIYRKAFDDIDSALEAGEFVCIFPEGCITRSGELQTFRSGVETIVQRRAVPVIPMALHGLWGSFFSRKYGAAMKRPFVRGIRSKIALTVGERLHPNCVSAARLQDRVASLLARTPEEHLFVRCKGTEP